MSSLQDVRQQLDQFGEQLGGINPELYRDLALYLQVLRDGLLNAVQQACFHLATRFHPDRYCQLGEGQRQDLHGDLADLVSRACSLLTVEQVAQLAGQAAREQRMRRRQRQQEWLAQLRKVSAEDGHASVDPDPVGSVHLAGALPIDPQRWQQGLIRAMAASPQQIESDSGPDSGDDELVGPGLGPDREDAEAELEALLDDNGESFLDALLEETPADSQPTPWDSPELPRDPETLLLWLEGFEQALGRRLRNLSHAINVDLLRAGLSPSLLPLSLLQAALQGQLDPLPSPANLLRLQLPLAPEAGGALESVAVLLRLADLELEQPRLRTCRSRWQRHRQEVRRMAEQHRRLQRRLQTLEAERLWLQDIPKLPKSPSQP